MGSIVSGHLDFNHTITKICIKERHQEELNTASKGSKNCNYQVIEKERERAVSMSRLSATVVLIFTPIYISCSRKYT